MSPEMPFIVVTEISYTLLIIVDFLLNIVYNSCYFVLFIIKLLLGAVFNVNMVETTKKRKRNSIEVPNKSIINRSSIDANWQKLLSSTLMMASTENKSEKSNENKQQYTGTFRRARKKKSNQPSNFDTSVNSSQIINNLHNKPNLENKNRAETSFPRKSNENRITKFIAMDCEMVGIGYDGEDHMLARVSLVNKFGDCIYDKFVKPREEVKDYRTKVSGVRREDLLNGEDFTTVQNEVSEILKGKILVGHSLKNDLSVLFLSHPNRNIRDTSKYKPFRSVTKGSTPSLKRLAKELLGIDIQSGEHSSVEDARAAMQLYCMVAKNWEQMMSEKRGGSRVVE
ncbi:uncharacterized protein [Epargyreus clarus]|uniref:uncharacterized protein n=1 Tax=Epargyreus clarus TaxID=520877 RepID=UPI003C2B6B8F